MTDSRKGTARARNPRRTWLMAGVLTASLIGSSLGIGPFTPTAATAADNDLFRVALYISSGKFNTTVPTAGFSAEKGLSIEVPAGTAGKAFTIAGGSSFRGGLDQFRVSVLITPDFTKAKAMQSALASKYAPSIYRNGTAAAPLYQVVTSGYPTAAAAQAASAEIAKLPAASSTAAGMSVTGPFKLNAGTYATEAQARTQAAALRGSGLPTDVVAVVDGAGKVSYQVWASHAAASTAAGSTAFKSALEASIPGVKLTAVDATKLLYLAEKEDASTTAAGTGGSNVHLFNPNGQKVVIRSLGGKITVKEKNLAYNGTFELSQLNGKMAVVNELPFGQYLNSVVHAELGPGFPAEALKAQAVAARTYSVKAGVRYEIANLTDTTLDQAYYGREADEVSKAVKATEGEVLMSGGKLIDALFSSNAGGQTADGSEVWGNKVSYLQSVASPDTYPTRGKLPWYRIVTSGGKTGYVRSDLLQATGTKSAAGIPLFTATDAANIRTIPVATDSISPVTGQLIIGEQVAVIEQTVESTAYSWTRLMTAAQLAPKINVYSPLTTLTTLQVSGRGPSSRVTAVQVNGTEVALKSPDSYRSMMGGLPSTLFEIEETGRYTVIGANGAKTEYAGTGSSLTAMNGQGTRTSAGTSFLVMNGQGKARLATSDAQFLFTGKGYGHGLGMSQFGAVGLALEGKSYQEILAYYYNGATIVKQ